MGERKGSGPALSGTVASVAGPLGSSWCVEGTVASVDAGLSRRGAWFQGLELADATGTLRALVLDVCSLKAGDAVRASGRLVADSRRPGLVLMVDRLEAAWKGRRVLLLDGPEAPAAPRPIGALVGEGAEALARSGRAARLEGTASKVASGTGRWGRPYARFELLGDEGGRIGVFAIGEAPREGGRVSVEGVLRLGRGVLELRARTVRPV